jgi:hypothetical protein
MFEAIDTGEEPATNFFRSMRMRHDRELSLVGFIHDRCNFFHRHLILIDQFDYIDSGFGKRAHFRTCVRRAFHAPTNIFRAGIRLVLNEWSRDVQRRTGYFTFLNPLTDCDACLQWSTQIARTRHPRHE